ncbi:TVP38/TMEM64 family protein [Paenibacillus chartarius]|uniref:TVP38/TMEM64 family membrane protein n=1 Tax=Paenibacillus chartarius TaxID=747481 RepID=A0ABV6DRD7_9BACL
MIEVKGMEVPKQRNLRWISGIGLLLIIGSCVYYAYLLHIGEAQRLMALIRDYGLTGIVVGIAVQALVNVLPVPGEFTTIALMEIYGPLWGGFYSFIGGVIGALGGLYLSKWLAKPLFGDMLEPYKIKVEEWLHKRETLGLLIIRFLPLVPYHFVNYAAGLLKVNMWTYTWTSAVGLIPYTIAFAGLFEGLRHGSLIWGAIGGAIFLVLGAINWMAKKRKQKASG